MVLITFMLTSVQLHPQTVYQAVSSRVNDEIEIRQNFQNLFDSVAKNDSEMSDSYREILKQKVTKERQAFDAIQEELRVTRSKNAHRKINFYKNSNVSENFDLNKRETNENNRGTEAIAPETRLDRVMRSKKLTVCTTGDYTPYTHLREDGVYEGIDVAMMQNLAASLDATIRWESTTWRTLTEDFRAKQCDVAAGGISATLERQRTLWLSEPLTVDSKIPLARCDDKAKYETMEQLNQPSVRLIAPAGGTNEAFARQHLPKANLQLTRDNAAIFQQIIDDKYDVIVTDASEALYQQNRYPQLCALNPKRPLQYIEKAYILPRDDMSWKLYIDRWLHTCKKTGVYDGIASRWMSVS